MRRPDNRILGGGALINSILWLLKIHFFIFPYFEILASCCHRTGPKKDLGSEINWGPRTYLGPEQKFRSQKKVLNFCGHETLQEPMLLWKSLNPFPGLTVGGLHRLYNALFRTECGNIHRGKTSNRSNKEEI